MHVRNANSHDFLIKLMLENSLQQTSTVIEEEEIDQGTQMYNFHKRYLWKLKEEMRMFEVKYRDQNFFREEDVM